MKRDEPLHSGGVQGNCAAVPRGCRVGSACPCLAPTQMGLATLRRLQNARLRAAQRPRLYGGSRPPSPHRPAAGEDLGRCSASMAACPVSWLPSRHPSTAGASYGPAGHDRVLAAPAEAGQQHPAVPLLGAASARFVLQAGSAVTRPRSGSCARGRPGLRSCRGQGRRAHDRGERMPQRMPRKVRWQKF